MDLNWQLGVASKGNLAGFRYPAPNADTVTSVFQEDASSKKRRWRGKTSKATGDRHFKFVEGRSGAKRGRKPKVTSNSENLESKSDMEREAEKQSNVHENTELPDVSPDSASFLGPSDPNAVIEDSHPHSGQSNASLSLLYHNIYLFSGGRFECANRNNERVSKSGGY